MIWNRNAVNLEGLGDYAEAAAPSVEFYGGRFAFLCGQLERADTENLERQVVAIEFPTMAIAREWYDSSRYEAAKGLVSMLQDFDAIFLDSVGDERSFEH
ncbi:DUF1330 domain-containing protein (plasmid) [Rhizobium sp. CB3171]|uniref:DUF1330 domain-containing protein n=1 Tax=Rhizobium sp. CB3171 TaxID=3039157 RepID=UPI0024B06267|nr:DUF1330 domain-containing protein [Rhizobium sp. CB3171]WFU07078.1 DUF1330 domain-containing protein [Rhizobium sp. CB3171]